MAAASLKDNGEMRSKLCDTIVDTIKGHENERKLCPVILGVGT